tara:strand:- start:2953 stop:4383 length:1431 start_codon:yes stop_codon:yes gene_type:complete
MKSFSLLFLLLSLSQAHASSGLISKLLTKIEKNSTQTKIAEQNQRSLEYGILSQKTIFNSTGYLRSSYSNQDNLPTSPFASTNTNIKEYEAGYQKLWTSGVQSNLSYLIRNSDTAFPGRSNFTFISPTLQLELSTSLIQSLFYDRYGHNLKNLELQEDLAKLDGKVEKKQTLVQALLDFSVLLEQKEELRLQKELCSSTKAQSENLSQKRKRGSVSKREYLLGLKDLNNCQATIERLDQSYLANLNAFESNYNTSFKEFSSPDVDKLFSEAQVAYQQISTSQNEVNISKQDDVRSLELQVDTLKSKQDELNAKTKTNLTLEFRSGLSGINDELSDAQQDVTDAKYPFVYVGLTLDLPLKNSQAVQESQSNFYRLESIKNRKDLLTKQKTSRLSTLESTLKKDFVIYEKYKKSVALSKNIFQEASRDFKNGRLDFNSLSEFNKSVIGDQKTLASHRIQLIVRVVEYLDFFQFFDTYL